MRDIIYRLSLNPSPWTCIKREAAQEIDALRKKIASLTAELEQVRGYWGGEIDRHNRTIDEAAALTAERDRLREALEAIVAEQRIGRVDEIARAALEETSK